MLDSRVEKQLINNNDLELLAEARKYLSKIVYVLATLTKPSDPTERTWLGRWLTAAFEPFAQTLVPWEPVFDLAGFKNKHS